jgi:cellulose synthase (UDP-forming)
MAIVADARRKGHKPISAPAGMPSPPTDKEKYSYTDRNTALIVRASLASFGALLISQSRFIGQRPELLVFAPLVLFTILYYLISLCVNFGTKGFDIAAHRRLTESWRPADYPTLDVFLPVCGEDLAVLRNTWLNVVELVNAYPGTATAYVLDDAASVEAGNLARDLGLTYVIRPDRGFMKKAGNLRHGFSISQGEFILILDADFAPRADLPLELLPYLIQDPTLGIVQSPQYFHVRDSQGWVERGAGAVQELFYRLVQVSRDRHNGAICVGSCAIYRRKALESNGGTTLIEHSEDVHTGFDLRCAGWGLRYVPMPLATGLCPSDPDSFLTQQYRWCAGSMSLLGSRKFREAKMHWRTRFCYVSGFCYYVHTAAFTIATPIIPLYMLIVMPDMIRIMNYVFIIPSIIYNFVVFPSWHRCRFGPTAFLAKLLYGWSHIFAIWDILRRHQMGWQTTGGSKRKSGLRRIWLSIAIWNGSTCAVWLILAIWRATQYGVVNLSVLILTGLFASMLTFMALTAKRNHRRVQARLVQ